MSRTPIEAEDIRKGDVVRAELLGTPHGGLLAVEYLAGHDEHAYYAAEADLFLVDRPVVLPTRLYSLVVPPASIRDRDMPYVLDTDGAGGTLWCTGGEPVADAEVAKALSNGWIAIDCPEVLP